jgi:hypothetical protein
VSPAPWLPEIAVGLTATALVGLGREALHPGGRWLGRGTALFLLFAVSASALFWLGWAPSPVSPRLVRWPPFVIGALTGSVVAWLLRPVAPRRVTRLPPPAAWRSLTQHEVSFLRRVWRTGFILEEDDALRQDRPEVLHATLHDLMETRALVYLDRVRGPSVRLRAYRLTAAGKDLMTWVTNAGR